MNARAAFAVAAGIGAMVALACVGEDPSTSPAIADASGDTPPVTTEDASEDVSVPETGCTDPSCDPKNCGRAAHDCLGGACVTGVCQPIVIAQGRKRPVTIAVADGALYWIEKASTGGSCDGSFDGLVMRANLDGTQAMVLANGQLCPADLIVHGPHVYWLSSGSGPANFDNGSLSRVPRVGGNVEVLYPNIRTAFTMTTDGTTVYWVAGRATTGTMDMWRAPLAGGGPKTWMGVLGDFYPSGMTLDATRVFFTTTRGRVGVTARTYDADSGAEAGASMLLIDGGAPAHIVNENAPVAGRLTWIDTLLGSVRQLPSTDSVLPDGSAPAPTDLAIKLVAPRGLAISNGKAYWFTQPGDLYEAPLDGSKAAVAFAKIPGGTLAMLAADDTAVYVTHYSEGTIYRVAKP